MRYLCGICIANILIFTPFKIAPKDSKHFGRKN